MKFNCADCGIDTAKAREVFVVDDIIWEIVTCDNPARYLCIGCVEERLGRELVRDDFLPLLINVQEISPKSDRLQGRLGNFTPTYIDLIHHRYHSIRDRNTRMCGITYECQLCEAEGLLEQLRGLGDLEPLDGLQDLYRLT